METEWILDVLADLRTFAHQNGLPALAEAPGLPRGSHHPPERTDSAFSDSDRTQTTLPLQTEKRPAIMDGGEPLALVRSRRLELPRD